MLRDVLLNHCANNHRDTALIQYEQILNIESPSRRNIGGVKTWMQHNQPIRDESKTYLENREVQGDLREILAKRRPNRDVEEGVQELVSLNKPSDSLLARYLRRSWLGIFLMVCQSRIAFIAFGQHADTIYII